MIFFDLRWGGAEFGGEILRHPIAKKRDFFFKKIKKKATTTLILRIFLFLCCCFLFKESF